MISNKAQNKTKGPLLSLIIVATIIIVSIFVIQKNQTNNRDFVKVTPEDFNFCLNFSTFGLYQIDTYNETFTKDLALGGTKTISFELPDDVKDEIYNLMMDIEILSYPKTLATSGSIPPCNYKLKVTIEGKTKTIIWDGGLYPSTTDNIPKKQADFLKLVIYKYLDCGDLHQGFARVKCEECHHEYLLPFSCKRRYFCPSCHQKRVVEFGEFLYSEILKQVPHRQWVFSLPKRLRPYFMYDRKLLPKLSQCAWKVLSCYLKTGVSSEEAMPGAVIAIQTFGDFLNFNPHLHIIATDGCFINDGIFMNGITPNASDLEIPFRYEVLEMLKREGKITNTVINNMDTWQHSGFHVYCGSSIMQVAWASSEAKRNDQPLMMRKGLRILRNILYVRRYRRNACYISHREKAQMVLRRLSIRVRTVKSMRDLAHWTGLPV